MIPFYNELKEYICLSFQCYGTQHNTSVGFILGKLGPLPGGAQGFLLVVLRRPYEVPGIETGLATCEMRTLPTGLPPAHNMIFLYKFCFQAFLKSPVLVQ